MLLRPKDLTNHVMETRAYYLQINNNFKRLKYPNMTIFHQAFIKTAIYSNIVMFFCMIILCRAIRLQYHSVLNIWAIISSRLDKQ